MSLLAIEEVTAGYESGIDVLNGLTLAADPGAVTIIIGPNGAGKSTLLRTIYGFLRIRGGTMTFDGRDISADAPHQIKHLGISYIPQEFNVFPHLTVEENLKMGAWIFKRDKARVREKIDHAYEIFPALQKFRTAKANTLSGGQMRMLSIAKELMTSPKLVLVDEPSAGLAPKIAAEAYEYLMESKRRLDFAILLVDHNMEAALDLADHVYVLDMGRTRVHGRRSEFDIPRIRQIIQECLLGDGVTE